MSTRLFRAQNNNLVETVLSDVIYVSFALKVYEFVFENTENKLIINPAYRFKSTGSSAKIEF